MLVKPFDELFTEDEIEKLRALYNSAKRVHPLVQVALHPGAGQSPDKITINTARALRRVLDQLPKWVKSSDFKKRLTESKDWTNSESALAEIRAAGALLEAGFIIEVGSVSETGAKPEFRINLEGVETIVEVWTRNLGAKDVKQLASDLGNSEKSAIVKNPDETLAGTITTAEASVAPFGAPDAAKEGDSVLTNVISRIAAIKEREHQAQDNRPFVLWVDLQNTNTLGGFDFSFELEPTKSGIRGGVESGGYWHALYGRKGDLLLENEEFRIKTNVMKHDGRFYQVMKDGKRTRVSGMIFSSPCMTAIMENPSPRHRLPDSFRNRLLYLPRFDISRSVLDWYPGLAAEIVLLQRRMIRDIAASLRPDDSGPSCVRKAWSAIWRLIFRW